MIQHRSLAVFSSIQDTGGKDESAERPSVLSEVCPFGIPLGHQSLGAIPPRLASEPGLLPDIFLVTDYFAGFELEDVLKGNFGLCAGIKFDLEEVRRFSAGGDEGRVAGVLGQVEEQGEEGLEV